MTVDSLPPELKEKLEPYITSSVYSSREYLNVIQRAFVKAKVAELKKTGQKLGDAFMAGVITEGVDNRIWTEDFRPSADKSLAEYLLGRMKNERRISNRLDIVATTRNRLESFMNDELSSLSNFDVSADQDDN